MRIERDKLIWHSLVTLAEQVELAHAGAPPPSHGVRLALAVLFSFGDGDRKPFDDFWRVMRDGQIRFHSDTSARYARVTFLQTQLRGVMRAVGVQPSVATELPLAQAARKACGDRVAPEALYRGDGC